MYTHKYTTKNATHRLATMAAGVMYTALNVSSSYGDFLSVCLRVSKLDVQREEKKREGNFELDVFLLFTSFGLS